MKAKVNIFLILIFIAGGCSPGASLSSGSDNLYYTPVEDAAANTGPENSVDTANIEAGAAPGRYVYGTDPYYWSSRLSRFHLDFYYDAGYYDPFYTGFSRHDTYGVPVGGIYEFYPVFISPYVHWLEILKGESPDSERPLWTYYTGPGPQFMGGNVHSGRRRGIELNVRLPLFSAVRALFSR